MRLFLLLALPGACFGQVGMLGLRQLGVHEAVFDERGILQSWMPPGEALDREMGWYLNSPREHGFPRFVTMTFMNGNYEAVESRPDFIPAMQEGTGILSYLKYYRFRGKSNPKVLEFARYMGDYLVQHDLTPNEGKYPRFTRSTGWRGRFPQPADCGTQKDRPYEVEPDKGGIAGYALTALYEETREKRYLDQAVQNARVLAANMRPGDETHSPWPFRVDYRTGEARGLVSANMSYILRLFDALNRLGFSEFHDPREKLWAWIREYQIPDVKKNAALWTQFFEDYDLEENRNAWSPLSLAGYLMEEKEKLDPEWRKDARALIDFVNRRFVTAYFGVAVCGEQDDDHDPWGGVLATYAGTLAKYAAATGDPDTKWLAHQALVLSLYAIDEDGCPGDAVWKHHRGGWQEDAHTDTVHNIVDALTAFPEWAK